jgi:ankyrin repeat protein
MIVNSSHFYNSSFIFNKNFKTTQFCCYSYLLNQPDKFNERREDLLQKKLRRAIRDNQPERAKAAILQGAPINRQDINANDGHNDYHIVRSSYYKCNEIAKILIENGAKLNVTCEHGHSPIMIVAARRNYELAEAYIKAGADVNHKDNDGLTALMEACKHHDEEMITLLINAGADVQVIDNQGNNALLYVMKDDFIRLLKHSRPDYSSFLLSIKKLIALSAIDFTDCDGNTALMIAVKEGLFDLIELLLEANPDRQIKNKFGQNAFDIAMNEIKSRNDLAKNYTEIIEILMEKELSTYPKGDTNSAADHPRLILYVDDLEKVKLFIKEGDDIDQQDRWSKNTALHLAASNGHAEIVKVLIEAKANVHLKNHFNNETALDGALRKQQNNLEEIETYHTFAIKLVGKVQGNSSNIE